MEYLGGTYANVVDIVTVVIAVCRVVAIGGRIVAISGSGSSVVTTHVDVVLHFLALVCLLVPTPRLPVLPISLG